MGSPISLILKTRKTSNRDKKSFLSIVDCVQLRVIATRHGECRTDGSGRQSGGSGLDYKRDEDLETDEPKK
jgi:hypothetical protein